MAKQKENDPGAQEVTPEMVPGGIVAEVFGVPLNPQYGHLGALPVGSVVVIGAVHGPVDDPPGAFGIPEDIGLPALESGALILRGE